MSEKSAVEITENGAAMDYMAHENTYDGFLRLFKWGTAACIALMVAMAIGFFAGGGLVGGTIVFAVLLAVSVYILK